MSDKFLAPEEFHPPQPQLLVLAYLWRAMVLKPSQCFLTGGANPEHREEIVAFLPMLLPTLAAQPLEAEWMVVVGT